MGMAPSHQVATLDRGDTTSPRTLNRTRVLELLVLVFITAVAQQALDSVTLGNNLTPHPFWLPVIILSLQYGTTGGLLATVVCSALHALLQVNQVEPPGDYYAVWLRVWLEPALWTGTALVLGGLRTRQIQREEELGQRLQSAENRARSLFSYNEMIVEQLRDLERHVATGTQLLWPELVDAILSFRKAGSPESALPTLFEALLGPGNYDLALGSRLSGGRGASAYRAEEDLQAGRVYGLLDTNNDVAQSRGALFVCTLEHPRTGQRLGTLTISKIERWTADIDQRVGLIASEVSLALADRDVRTPVRRAFAKPRPRPPNVVINSSAEAFEASQ